VKFLSYFSLGGAVYSAIEQVIAVVRGRAPIQGVSLMYAVLPAVNAVTATFRLRIPEALSASVAEAAASAINAYYKKAA